MSQSAGAISGESVGVGLVSMSAGWMAEWANTLGAERLGQRAGAIGGLRLSAMFDGGEAIEERLKAGLSESGQGFASEARTLSGAILDVWARATPGGGAMLTLVDAGARIALQADLARVREQLAKAERARERVATLQRETSAAAVAPEIIGRSAGIRDAIEQVERVAPTGATALVHGETGAGKDLIARLIHARSPRAERAFVAVNCAALPETLIESELFGHERGAFTGADRQRIGKFELADEGTLFLDEIAELSMQAQAKLLRVLQGGQFERVGGAETITADVRLVAATHRDLARQVERGRFREDLFYRLNVFRIDVPPLRERKEDIRPLIEFLHERHARRMGKAPAKVSDRSMRRALAYRWPGNIRELENAVERATLLHDEGELEIELPDSPSPGAGTMGADRGGGGAQNPQNPRDVLLDLSAEQLQRIQIMHALETSGYRVFGEGGAAKKLGMNPQTLVSRMVKLGIPRPRQMRGEGKHGGEGN